MENINAKYKRIEVAPSSGALGAEISGVDLRTIDDETFEELHAAWLDHLVVFLRDQDITPEQQSNFASRFGDFHYHPYMQGMDEHPEILEIVKEPGDSYTFGASWHSDQMFNPEPAKATFLYAKEAPDAGGDTMFANMYAAYDALSDGMRGMLAEVRTFNVGDRRRLNGGTSRKERYGGNAAMSAKVRDPGNVPTEAAHPLFRTHPETGKKALYIGGHTQTFEGFTEKEVDPLVTFLRGHSTRPEFTCRFRWEPGSMAIWDNRCTQHYAVPDYNQRRWMHRITIAGDTPY